MLFSYVCIYNYRKLFIKDRPNSYYTLVISIVIFLFSFFLLIELLTTLLNIMDYQRIQDSLTSEELPDIS